VVVVEIGNDCLKIVECTGKTISKFHFVKLVEIKGTVERGIEEIFKNLKLNKRNIIVIIPRHLVTVRMLEFPSTNEVEISNMVSLQVGKQTPYSKEEIVFTHMMAGTLKEGYSRVMLVIARRNIINERVDVLQKAGISIDKVAVSSEGVFHWLNLSYASEMEDKDEENLEATTENINVVIDIDSSSSDLMVVRKERFVFTRNISIGANQLIDIGGSWKDKFINELSRAIQLYIDDEKNVKISKIYLSGAGKNVADLVNDLKLNLNFPTVILDPLNNIRINNDQDIFEKEKFKLISVSSILGIALNPSDLKLDLTMDEMRIQQLMDAKRNQIISMGILLISIVMMISLLLGISIYKKNAYLNLLKKKISGIGTAASEVEKMRLSIDLVEGRLDASRRSINILSEIYQLTPKEIFFTNINIDEEKQTILQGRAFAMSDVFAYVTILESSAYFKDVKTTYSTKKRDDDGEYAKFEIICDYEKE